MSGWGATAPPPPCSLSSSVEASVCRRLSRAPRVEAWSSGSPAMEAHDSGTDMEAHGLTSLDLGSGVFLLLKFDY
jgi:hypothetical protein